MTITATVKQADQSIDHVVLTEPARIEMGNNRADVFAARYGDLFACACSNGGLFVGVLRVAEILDLVTARDQRSCENWR
jgi:hypothetical protein